MCLIDTQTHKGRVHIVAIKYLNSFVRSIEVGTRGVCLPVTAATAVLLFPAGCTVPRGTYPSVIISK